MSFNKKKQKQSSVYPLFQPLQLRASTEPPPRNDEDSDDDEEDWDIPLTSLMTKHPNNAKGNNDTNAKTEKREETVKTKKRPPTTATTTKRQTSKKSKSSSSSLEGTSFTTARAMLNQTKLSSVLSRKQKEETRESQPTVTMQSSASGSVISSLSTTTSTSTDTNKQNATNKPLPRPRNPEPLQPESSSQENENNSTVNNNKTPGQQKFQQRQDLPQDKNDIPMCLDDEPEQEETKQPPDPLTEPISKTNRRPRRIFSDSSSEIPFSPPAEKSFHILSQLLERTRLGGQTFTTKNFNAPQWKIPSWVALEAPPSKLLCMSWDSMGVLLAVAFADQMIRVYDWDMVRAADLQGRRDRTRQNKTTLYKLPPILQFQTPTVVSTIVWNRYDLDQLAVGFRYVRMVLGVCACVKIYLIIVLFSFLFVVTETDILARFIYITWKRYPLGFPKTTLETMQDPGNHPNRPMVSFIIRVPKEVFWVVILPMKILFWSI